MTLHGLHRAIQLMMGWFDYHLYQFTIDGVRYEQPMEEAEGLDSTGVSLASLKLKKGQRFSYTYDFGDDWSHEITVEGRKHVSEGAWLPWVVSGERAGPPEDCGGVHGYEEFLAALADPEHPEHEQYRTWVGEDYHPELFDVRAVRNAVILAGAWGALEADRA